MGKGTGSAGRDGGGGGRKQNAPSLPQFGDAVRLDIYDGAGNKTVNADGGDFVALKSASDLTDSKYQPSPIRMEPDGYFDKQIDAQKASMDLAMGNPGRTVYLYNTDSGWVATHQIRHSLYPPKKRMNKISFSSNGPALHAITAQSNGKFTMTSYMERDTFIRRFGPDPVSDLKDRIRTSS